MPDSVFAGFFSPPRSTGAGQGRPVRWRCVCLSGSGHLSGPHPPYTTAVHTTAVPTAPLSDAAEFSSLMQTLTRLHTGERGLMLQGKCAGLQRRVGGQDVLCTRAAPIRCNRDWSAPCL